MSAVDASSPAAAAGSSSQSEADSHLQSQPHTDDDSQREARLEKMSAAAKTLIECLGEDASREGLLKTPRRVARALLEMTTGYGLDAGAVLRSALFNVHSPDLVVVQDIDFASNCEHHMLPFFGKVRSRRSRKLRASDVVRPRCRCTLAISLPAKLSAYPSSQELQTYFPSDFRFK